MTSDSWPYHNEAVQSNENNTFSAAATANYPAINPFASDGGRECVTEWVE